MWDSEVYSVTSTPERDDSAESEQNHGYGVRPFRALGTVTEGTDSDNEEKRDIEL